MDTTMPVLPTVRGRFAMPWGFILLAIICLPPLFLFSLGGERYCFFWPSIDTQKAAGFTFKKFEQVTPGMTVAEVTALLGAPLRTDPLPRGYMNVPPGYRLRADEVWHYTFDGAAPWGDWAWFSRNVLFRDGKVVERVSWTYHD